MGPTVGIFFDRASAERAVGNLKAGGLSPKSIHVLVPDSEPLVAKMPMSEAEQPGMGKAIGGVIGGAVGVASGAEIGAAAAASALLPVAGPAIAIGIVGGVLLSLSGAAVGGALENALESGLPKDELFVYEEALRRGYAIVVVTPTDADGHERCVLEGPVPGHVPGAGIPPRLRARTGLLPAIVGRPVSGPARRRVSGPGF